MYGSNPNSSASYGQNGQYGGNNQYSNGANRQNNYGGNNYSNNSYGGNNSSSYGNGNPNQRPAQYGQQYGSNQQNYGGNQQSYGGNQQSYGGNQQSYGGNQQNYGGNNYGGNNYGGNGYGRPIPGQETEEDVNQVSQQIRDVRQESVNSTRNAIRVLQETDESGIRTMNQLAEQSEQLGRIERSLDSAQIHADNAQEKAGELKTVNRSMFAIHIKNPFNSTKKKERELEEAKRKAAEELAQREAIRREEYESKQRVNAVTGNGPYGRANSSGNGYSNNGRGGSGERNMYSFENTAEDDEAEREIDNNLDIMSNYLDRLKASASAMNTEVNEQNSRMGRITGKTDNLSGSVTHNTNLLQKIAKRG